jgi:hypothetical protein
MGNLIKLEFLELHSPLFLAGTNLGVKLDPVKSKHRGLVLEYDRPNQEVLVSFGGKVGIIPFTNVVAMIEGEPELKEEVQPAPQFTTRTGAQVDSPQGHVFKGPGHGKTGK